MIDKSVSTLSEAIAGIHDGATIMIGGFGPAGQPTFLIDALIDQGARDLTIINNNAGNGGSGSRGAAESRASTQDDLLPSRARWIPRFSMTSIAAAKWSWSWCRRVTSRRGSGQAGAGLGAVFTPTGYGTPLAEGKETREIDGRHYVLEYPIKADFALIKAHQGDRWGNLVYRKAARNFGPIMATAAKNHHRRGLAAGAAGRPRPGTHHHPRHFRPACLLAGKPDCRTTRLRSPRCKN